MNTVIKTDAKSLATIRRSLRAKNAAFRKLTLAKQRVRIAQDVIDQLAAKEISAQSRYFYQPDVYRGEGRDLDLSEVACQTRCDVCGIGSLFLAAVRRCDKVKVGDFLGSGDCRRFEVKYLAPWFSVKQLNLVELYFEDRWVSYTAQTRSPIMHEYDKAKRLRMIMENIASNRGKFDPRRGAHKYVRRGETP